MDDDVLIRPRAAAKPRPISPSEIAGDPRPFAAEPEAMPDTQGHVSDDQAKKADPLPRPGDADYRACARFLNRLSTEQRTFYVVKKDFSYRAFPYSEFDGAELTAGAPGSGPVLVVRFAGSEVTDVKIKGRHLFEIFEYVGLHKMPWVWEHPAPHDFLDERKPLISSIIFEKVERG